MVGRLDGKTALITGGARGQGEAEARLFAEEGANVMVTDVLDDALGDIVKSIGVRARGTRADASSEADWARAVDETLAAFGRLDILVNNAAIYRVGPIEQERLEDFNRVLSVNLTGVFLGIRACIPALRAAGGGSIINISSVAGLEGFAGHAAYGSAKWGVRGLTKIAALELGQYGIRVNSVHPGAIDTEMIRPYARDGADRGAAYPIARIGTPTDVAQLALYLASDESTYVSGAEITIDGGLAAGSPMVAVRS
ncbi:MAG TPA: glucose 1-dehydrogenase [Acidimicrobiales bacterium]|nr:glucose 1-dehydrogenase [Acidimicrobiales bacterium]